MPMKKFFTTFIAPMTPVDMLLAIAPYSGRILSVTKAMALSVKLFIHPSSIPLSPGIRVILRSSQSLRLSILDGRSLMIFTTLSTRPGIIIHSIPPIITSSSTSDAMVPMALEIAAAFGISRFGRFNSAYTLRTVKLYTGQSRYAIISPYINGVSIETILLTIWLTSDILYIAKNTIILHKITRNAVKPHFMCFSSKLTFI